MILKYIKLVILCMLFLNPSLCFADDIKITVVYNNVPYSKELATGWGISIFIEWLEKSILFDTGGDDSILLSNMEKLKIDPKKINIVVLSHIHGDHVGGLWGILEENKNILVYLPSSFPFRFKERVTKIADKVVFVKEAVKICEHTFSTGELGKWIKEQSLIIDTKKGRIVITGCAHPGIVNIVRVAKTNFDKDIYLVLGGFHLMAYSENEVRKIIKDLKELGVEKVGPSHCTGGKQIGLFRKAWGKDFIDLGCGAKIGIE